MIAQKIELLFEDWVEVTREEGVTTYPRDEIRLEFNVDNMIDGRAVYYLSEDQARDLARAMGVSDDA